MISFMGTFFVSGYCFLDWRAQNPSATLSGDNVAWEETTGS
jgi:hypothetical protein